MFYNLKKKFSTGTVNVLSSIMYVLMQVSVFSMT